VRFQGFHGNVLIVLDEAPGVLPEFYEAIEAKASAPAATCGCWRSAIPPSPAGRSTTLSPPIGRAGT
jgi:hypothetical protein